MTPKEHEDQAFTFWVPGPLPGFNEILAASNKHRFAYGELKSEWTNRVAGWIVISSNTHKRRSASLPRFDKVTVECEWVEKDKRRDPDNIHAGVKFVCDGMERAGLIPRDSQKHIKGISHILGPVNKKKPGVRVAVREI